MRSGTIWGSRRWRCWGTSTVAALRYNTLRYPHHLKHLLLVGASAAWDYTDHIVFEQSGRYPFVEEGEAFR